MQLTNETMQIIIDSINLIQKHYPNQEFATRETLLEHVDANIIDNMETDLQSCENIYTLKVPNHLFVDNFDHTHIYYDLEQGTNTLTWTSLKQSINLLKAIQSAFSIQRKDEINAH